MFWFAVWLLNGLSFCEMLKDIGMRAYIGAVVRYMALSYTGTQRRVVINYTSLWFVDVDVDFGRVWMFWVLETSFQDTVID